MNLIRIGIFGGTFDPVHEGHITLAKQALKLAALDKVVFVPMARASYRDAVAPIADRMAMCRLAVSGEENICVSDAGTLPSVCYTADTLPHLKREFPDAQFSLIIGADKLLTLPYWKNAKALFEQVDILCFPRPGIDPNASLEKALDAGARITLLSSENLPYSSTLIRSQTAQLIDAPGLPPSVLCYMAQNGLYQPDYESKLKTMVNPRRYRHTLGVRTEAVRLAALHHLPIQKAAMAGLLHDCAKGMQVKELQKIATQNNLVSDPDLLSSNAMLHGPVGAYVAQQQFGIQDEDVLYAIRSHTIGRPGMTMLELCVFVADATEAGREVYEGLDRIRKLADVSLPAAALESLHQTRLYLERENRPFFPIAQATVDYLQSLPETANNKQ